MIEHYIEDAPLSDLIRSQREILLHSIQSLDERLDPFLGFLGLPNRQIDTAELDTGKGGCGLKLRNRLTLIGIHLINYRNERRHRIVSIIDAIPVDQRQSSFGKLLAIDWPERLTIFCQPLNLLIGVF